MKNEILPKGLKEIIDEDPSLKRKVTNEELTSSTKEGFDDSLVEKVYKEYKNVLTLER